MKARKNTLVGILLVISMLISITMPVFAQTSDITGHWAAAQLNNWLEKGLIQGYEDGSFKPDNNITRAEFVAVLNRALGLTAKTAITFSDVSSDVWYAGDIEKAKAAAYISGYRDGTFKPDNPITRVEVAKILSSVMKLKNYEAAAKLNGYQDAGDIPQWGKESLNSAVIAKYFQGYSDNTIRPLNNISRAEAVTVLYQALGTVYNVAGIYGPEKDQTAIKGNVTVSSPGVNIRNAKIEGNLILTAGVGDGNVQLDNVSVTGRTLISGGGTHSVIIRNSNLNEVLVDKDFGETPRIVAEGTSVIGNVTLESAARLEENNLAGQGFGVVRVSPTFTGNSELQLAGDFQVNVDAKANIVLAEGNVTLQTSAQAGGTTINVLKEATIVNFIAGASAQVKGEGKIKKAEINASGLTFQQQVTELVLGQGVTASIAGKILDKSNILPGTVTPAVNPGTDSGHSNPSAKNPPELTANITNNEVGQEINLSFADDPAWRAAINDITVNYTSIAGHYSANPGCIIINADVFTEACNNLVIVKATGYQDATVIQAIKQAGPGGMPGTIQDNNEIHYYFDIINLKSVVFRNYLSGDMGYPICDVKLMHQAGDERWRILNADNPNSGQAVKFNDTVYLQSDWWWGNYLQASGDNADLKLVPQPSAWVIKDSTNPDSTATVKLEDTVFFQSVNYGNYLSGQGSGDNAGVKMIQTPGAYERWLIAPKDYICQPGAVETHYGDIVNIKSDEFRTHVSGTDGSYFAAVQLKQHPGETEQWIIKDPDQPGSTEAVKFNEPVNLQSVYWSNYISVHYSDEYTVDLVDQPYQLETWKFINAANPDSTETVKPDDKVLLQSASWGNYLSGQGSGDNAGIKMVTLPEDTWYIIPKDYFRNWMLFAPEIVNKPLREVAFPATHDTGTWAFIDEIAPEDENTQLINDALTTVDEIITQIDQIAFLNITSDQLQQIKNAAYGVVYDSIKDLARCNDYNIAQQLDAGIRWLDLRMYLADDGAYTHHFLKGVDMDSELDSIKAFIEDTKGEILVVEMSHFVGEEANYEEFANQLRTKLGPYAVSKEVDSQGNIINPFNKTYGEIMGNNPASSMVILIMMGPEDVTNDPIFWNYTQLGIKYDTYEYSNKTTAQVMIDDQLAKFNLAKQNGDLFTLWYTLTCDPDDSPLIVTTRMAEELANVLCPIIDSSIDGVLSNTSNSDIAKSADKLSDTGNLYSASSWWDDIIDGAEDVVDGVEDIIDGIETGINTVEDLINYLKNHPDIPNPKEILKKAAHKKLDEIIASLLAKGDCGYKSVKDLSDKVNPDLQTTLEQQFQNFYGSQTSGNNDITVIYGDFFENALLVETAIRYSRMP
ncbi:MAG: S-layer homology domain-containing protein [Syntrophomonas sp.]